MAHHYHFVVDLLWPLTDLLTSAERGSGPFSIARCAPAAKELETLFPGRVTVVDDGDAAPGQPRRELVGFNPMVVRVTRRDASSFAGTVVGAAGATVDQAEPPRVVMIRRGPTAPHLAARGHTSGTARRAITNHDELAAIADEVSPVPVHHVVLEDLAFIDQVVLLSGASVIVGQHGAGLVNSLWMPPGTMLELGQRKYNHFKRIAELGGHRHLWMEMPGRVAAADPTLFRRLFSQAVSPLRAHRHP